MSKDQPYLPRPGVDEKMIVDEMIREERLEHWEECYKFVMKCVYAKAKNMPPHHLDDIVQVIMIKITIYLLHFRFKCALKTWVNQIIEHQIIDEYRKLRNEGPHLPFSLNPPGDPDGESQEPGTNEGVSAEEAFEMQEKIRIGMAALLEYANTHANPVRNWHIIQLVLFEEKTYEEAAIAVGCNPPVVGYVIREAQRYARDKIRNQE